MGMNYTAYCKAAKSTLFLVLLENYGGIVSAKPKRITHGRIDCPILRFIKSKVQFRIQIRIICKVIDGRWYDIMLDSHDGSNGFHRSGSPQQVTCHGLGRTDVQTISVFTIEIQN